MACLKFSAFCSSVCVDEEERWPLVVLRDVLQLGLNSPIPGIFIHWRQSSLPLEGESLLSPSCNQRSQILLISSLDGHFDAIL